MMEDQCVETRPIRPAASLLLIRDGVAGVEVLAVKRSEHMRAFPGFIAFPGGMVEQEDDLCARQCTTGNVIASQRSDDAVFAIAALRETAEETGWLGGLFRADGGSHHTILPEELHLTMLREKDVLYGELKRLGLLFWLEGIRFVGRWVTPKRVEIPVRFDTRFFVCEGYQGDLSLRANGEELAWVRWSQPAALLADIEERREKAAIPTQAMLHALAKAPSVAWCLAHLDVPSPFST